MPRRRPEFESGAAGAEAAKLEKFSDAGGSQIQWLLDAGRADFSITSGIHLLLIFLYSSLFSSILLEAVIPMKSIATVLFLSFQVLYASPSQEDYEKAAMNHDYFAHVILSGVVRDMVFPGPPNFVSVEEGDWAEPRWILDVDEQSLERLVKAQAGIKDGCYMGEFIDSELRADEPNANWVTLDSFFAKESESIAYYENKKVTIDAVISAQPAHCHTPFVVEIAEVLTHE